MKINIGKWLRRQVLGGDPVTIDNLYDLVAAIRSDTALRESLEAKVKKEILLSLDLETAEATLAGLAPKHKQQIAAIVNRFERAILDWQL